MDKEIEDVGVYDGRVLKAKRVEFHLWFQCPECVDGTVFHITRKQPFKTPKYRLCDKCGCDIWEDWNEINSRQEKPILKE